MANSTSSKKLHSYLQNSSSKYLMYCDDGSQSRKNIQKQKIIKEDKGTLGLLQGG